MPKQSKISKKPASQPGTLKGWRQIAEFLGQSGVSVVKRGRPEGMLVSELGRLVTTSFRLVCMRKRLMTPPPEVARSRGGQWLDVDQAAIVEFTSEAKDYPIESALVAGESPGWRAGTPGTQMIRLVFDEPQKLKLISLIFEEKESARTQEFVLRWSPDNGISYKEIVRQQWNFSPPETIREVEEYQVDLSNVTVLELTVVPDLSGGAARASLKSLHLF